MSIKNIYNNLYERIYTVLIDNLAIRNPNKVTRKDYIYVGAHKINECLAVQTEPLEKEWYYLLHKSELINVNDYDLDISDVLEMMHPDDAKNASVYINKLTYIPDLYQIPGIEEVEEQIIEGYKEEHQGDIVYSAYEIAYMCLSKLVDIYYMGEDDV